MGLGNIVTRSCGLLDSSAAWELERCLYQTSFTLCVD